MAKQCGYCGGGGLRTNAKFCSYRCQLSARSERIGECVVWTGEINRDGYGMMWQHNKVRQTHRVSYEVFVGKIPEGLCVCHRCDNPTCIRPEHLFLGTQQENVADKVAKNRQAKGFATCPQKNRKLDDQQVRAIRLDRRSQSEIAKQYGVSDSLVGFIKLRKIWKHVD